MTHSGKITDADVDGTPGKYDHIELADGKSAGVGVSASGIESAVDIENAHVHARVVSSEHVRKYDENDDRAMKAFAEYDGEPLVMDEATNKRLLRTIDWHIMPIL